MSFDKEYYEKLEVDFAVWKRSIIRRNASILPNIIKVRTDGILNTYNDIVKLFKPIFAGENDRLKATTKARLLEYRKDLINCFLILNVKAEMPNDLTKEIKLKAEEPTKDEMATEKFKYINNISKIICNNYRGDSNGLNAFLTAIDLANDITEPEQQPILVKYIKTKLEGIALEAIPENVLTANNIVDALRSKIKTENSKVVLGRYMALRAERSSLTKFQTDAEELSDQLRRAYISEGMTQQLAEKMTIDKTVDMCRLSAKTNLVKSVLASSDFKNPKDVLAKLITESTAENSENSILYYRSNTYRGNMQRGNSNRGFRGNFRGNFNGYRNNNYTNNRNSSYGGNRYNRNFNNNFNNNRNYSNNRGNQQPKGYQNNSSYSRNRNERNTFVRAFTQENETSPTSQRGNATRTVTMSEI